MRSLFALTIAFALCAPFAARAQMVIPPKLGFSGRLTDSAGVPVPDGSHSGTLTFKDGSGTAIGSPIAIGGASGNIFVTVDGYFALNVDISSLMGVSGGPPASVDLSYEGGTALPMPIDSVVYAFQAMDAGHLEFNSPTGTIQNGQDVNGVQTIDVNLMQTLKTDATSCSQNGAYMQRIDYPSRTIFCALPPSSITSVTGGGQGGLTVTQSGSAVTLSQDSNTVRLNAGSSGCPANAVLVSNGNNWSCAVPQVGVTSLTASPGLVASGSTGAVTVGLNSCSQGQILQETASGWACANPPPTYLAGTSITLQSNVISLAACTGAGQVWAWSGSAWQCTKLVGPIIDMPLQEWNAGSGGPTLTTLTVGRTVRVWSMPANSTLDGVFRIPTGYGGATPTMNLTIYAPAAGTYNVNINSSGWAAWQPAPTSIWGGSGATATMSAGQTAKLSIPITNLTVACGSSPCPATTDGDLVIAEIQTFTALDVVSAVVTY